MAETQLDRRTSEATETGAHDKYKHIVLEGVRVPPADQESGEVFMPTGNSVIEGFVNGGVYYNRIKYSNVMVVQTTQVVTDDTATITFDESRTGTRAGKGAAGFVRGTCSDWS